jgi:hypothetical protein
LGIKREDCPATFAGQSESRFFCSSGVGIPLVPTQASILSHSRAPSTPPAGQIEKESEKAAQTKPDDFGGNELNIPSRSVIPKLITHFPDVGLAAHEKGRNSVTIAMILELYFAPAAPWSGIVFVNLSTIPF